MSVKEAKQVLEEERFKFQFHLKKKGIKQAMLAPVIGSSTSYIRQLLNGLASGKSAYDNLQKLFEFTGYEGENWF
ncbi:helix-turn-helix domain-containing protein [Fructobacillus fructosus]|uniref:helix-turn-helix domain-containing protein n=1 Tax=Fructobacillus fructosus TaxID=1631 RepID=UPI004033755A